MVAVCVTSSASGDGKTTVCAGLGRYLLGNGKRVGFFKPVVPGGERRDGDAAFMRNLLALDGTLESLTPVFQDAESLKSAFAIVSAGKDVVLIEGEQSQTSVDLVAALDARVISVGGYSPGLQDTIDYGKRFGARLLGIVVNKVPQSRLEQVRNGVSSLSEKAGVKALGTLPEDRSLMALSVSEVVELVDGKIVSGGERSDELIENIMLGALAVDPGPVYFARKVSKAVVVKSGRPDLQMAALHTPTACLVVAGDSPISQIVLQRAARENVPVVSSPGDAASVVTRIEEALDRARFCQRKKLPRLDQIMQQHFDFAAVMRGLSLAG